MSGPLVIDARKAACELTQLKFVAAQLKQELFEQCCQFQRDPESVDLEFLARLSGSVRAAEQRKRLLEHVLELHANLAAGVGQNG